MGVTVGTTLAQSCHPQKSKGKSIAQTFFHLINMQGRTHLVPFPLAPLEHIVAVIKACCKTQGTSCGTAIAR